ncbi:MAG: tripartite tricarboxylate transporter substrate binding protein, partial [Burkholderiales bacterium]|nr:tripartite tricarboxylate transporter substrate binding protein [Burkholderiales bacterium]
MLRPLKIFCALGCLITASAWAQNYPTRAVRIVVPLAAGGPVDAVTRILAVGLTERLGQQIVVDNRPGAGGSVGAELVARAPADGYTLLMAANGTLAIA